MMVLEEWEDSATDTGRGFLEVPAVARMVWWLVVVESLLRQSSFIWSVTTTLLRSYLGKYWSSELPSVVTCTAAEIPGLLIINGSTLGD